MFADGSLRDRTGSDDAARWTAQAAYGLPAFSGRFTASPHVDFRLADGARDLSLGWRWTPATNAPALPFGVRAIRSERDAAAPDHALGLEMRAQW